MPKNLFLSLAIVEGILENENESRRCEIGVPNDDIIKGYEMQAVERRMWFKPTENVLLLLCPCLGSAET